VVAAQRARATTSGSSRRAARAQARAEVVREQERPRQFSRSRNSTSAIGVIEEPFATRFAPAL
jgi:hypothetical protein